LQFERLDSYRLANRTAANALSANAKRRVGSIGKRHVDLLQVRNEFPTGNTGDFRTNTTEILRLATNLDNIADLNRFSTNFALPSHRIALYI